MEEVLIMRKTMLITILFMIATICFVPLSYTQASNDKTTIQDVKQETQDLITKIKGYTADQRDEAIKQTEQALKKLDNRIDALETDIYNSWDQMDKAAREKAQSGLKELRKQRIELAEWYGSLKNSSLSVWEQVKKGFSDAYQAIIDTWAKFKSKY
jgi:septal ring factor EnvC (AmiA/AmiB activator)